VIAAFSVGISILALGFSFFIFISSRQKDQRDTFLRLHELLNDDDTAWQVSVVPEGN
jgi:hypothetical protein